MLREGWDVRNVTTVVPLRPLSSKANILPEQTLGRGLRRMTPPGQVNEIVTVVEHPAFASGHNFLDLYHSSTNARLRSALMGVAQSSVLCSLCRRGRMRVPPYRLFKRRIEQLFEDVGFAS